MLHDKPVKDYDFYFKDKKPESDYMYAKYFIEDVGHVTVTINSVTIVTYKCSFQFIHRKSGNPKEIVSKFDFAHDLEFYNVCADSLKVSTISKFALSDYGLLYNYETDINPFVTIKRLAKFLSCGMKCDEHNLNNMMCHLYRRIEKENIQIDDDCLRGES